MAFSGVRRDWRVAAVAIFAAALAGCAAPVVDEGFAGRGAVDTGTYPNLNVAPAVATTQFTPYSLNQHNNQLTSAHDGQDAEGSSAAATVSGAADQARRLKKLNQTHGKETLDAIESAGKAPAATN